MNIKGIYHIINTDSIDFHKDLMSAVTSMQADGQEVDIQYGFASLGNRQVVSSALVLGRKDDSNGDV
jgi:hypothetical protein